MIFGKRRFGIIIFIIMLMSGVAFYATSQVTAQESGVLSLAPLNPDFLKYIQGHKIGRVQSVTGEGHALGYIPSPVDLSHLKGLQIYQSFRALKVSSPSSYDLRTLSKLTPVKDQGSCGCCWAFATYGSLESNLLPGETWDFSENNLKNTNGFDLDPCEGGDAPMSVAYLARWSGPINEPDDPYNPSSNVSPPGLEPVKHIQEVLIIPDRANSLDNENIKQAVMNYGALFTSTYMETTYYNPAYATYYYNGSNDANHAVAIVGWDDNFDKNLFPTVPPGNGAFIVRNSWGTDWGDSGYFYISYYDSEIGKDNYVFNGAKSTTNYDRVYQYDPLGWTNSVGYKSNTAWFANIFTAVENEQLSAVSFYTVSTNSTYKIFIYSNVTSDPISGLLAGSQTGSIVLPGYHTIPLNFLFFLPSGQKFSVVVKLTTPGVKYPVAVEMPITDYSSQATANAGESYISDTGTSWTDITTLSDFADTNVCLKAFTTVYTSTTPPSAPISLTVTPSSWTNSNLFSIDWTNPSDLSGIAGAYYKVGTVPTSDTDGTYTTSKPFNVSATSQGGQAIYVWLEDGAGNTSYLNSNSTTLYYDGTPPTDGVLDGASGNTSALLTWGGFSDSGGSGLSSRNTYKVVRNTGGNPDPQCTSGIQVYLGSGTSIINKGLVNGITYYYRVCAYDNVGNVSAGAIAQVTPLAVTVISPNGGEIIPAGLPYTIRWGAPSQAMKFKLKYSLDNRTTWKLITPDFVMGSSYDWTVPIPKNNKRKCFVKVIGFDSEEKKVGADRSDAPFTIEVVRVTSPNGGETFVPGDSPTITWTTNATKSDVANVKLFYTKNGGNTWKLIETLTENTGSYTWDVPSVPKTKDKCKVKIVLKDADGKTVGKDVSDDYFTIQPSP
jgi:C1A family cysteine protease